MSTTARAADQWVVLRGPISAETITTAATALAERRQLQCALDEGAGTLRLTDPVTSHVGARGVPGCPPNEATSNAADPPGKSCPATRSGRGVPALVHPALIGLDLQGRRYKGAGASWHPPAPLGQPDCEVEGAEDDQRRAHDLEDQQRLRLPGAGEQPGPRQSEWGRHQSKAEEATPTVSSHVGGEARVAVAGMVGAVVHVLLLQSGCELRGDVLREVSHTVTLKWNSGSPGDRMTAGRRAARTTHPPPGRGPTAATGAVPVCGAGHRADEAARPRSGSIGPTRITVTRALSGPTSGRW